MLNKLIQFIVLIVLVLIYLNGAYPRDASYLYITCILVTIFISLFSFFFFKREEIKILHKQYLKISTLFILSFVIVHFQMYLDLILGNVSIDTRFLWINNRIVIKSILLSSIAISSYCLGYSIFTKKVINRPIVDRTPIRYSFLNIVGFLLLVGFFATVNSGYISGETTTERGSAAGYLSLLFQGVICAIQIINARNLIVLSRTRLSVYNYLLELRIPILLLLMYLTVSFLSGDRGPILFNGLFATIVYIFVSKRKIALYKLLLIGIGAAFILTIIGIARGLDGEGNMFKKVADVRKTEVENRYYPKSISPITKSLAASGRAVNIANDYIEHGGKHTYGIFALQDLMLLVPSLKGNFIELFDVPKFYTSSPQLLTFYELGPYATWGVGGSSVADTYLDFGVVGVILIYLLFGYVSRYIEVKTMSRGVPGFLLLSIGFSIFAFSIYIPRATILYSLNFVTYIAGFIYMTILFNKRKFI